MGTKVGFNNSVGIGNFIILSNANMVIVNPNSPGEQGREQGRIVSTSVDDTSAGTGIQKVIIAYIDTNWNRKQK